MLIGVCILIAVFFAACDESDGGGNVDTTKPVKKIIIPEVTANMTQEQVDNIVRSLMGEFRTQSSTIEAKFVKLKKTFNPKHPGYIPCDEMPEAQRTMRRYFDGESAQDPDMSAANIAGTAARGMGQGESIIFQHLVRHYRSLYSHSVRKFFVEGDIEQATYGISQYVNRIVAAGGPQIDFDLNNLAPALAATKKAINDYAPDYLPAAIITDLLQQQEDMGQFGGFASDASRLNLSASPRRVAGRSVTSNKKVTFTMPEAAPEEVTTRAQSQANAGLVL